MEEVQAVLLCKSFLGSWVVLAPRRCTEHRVGGSGGGGGGIQLGVGGLEKASAPESRKYRQPFCDKLFSAGPCRAAPRTTATAPESPTGAENAAASQHGKAQLHGRTHGEKVWTRSRKGESRGGLATAPRYSTPVEARRREFSLSTPEQTEGGRGNEEKKRG